MFLVKHEDGSYERTYDPPPGLDLIRADSDKATIDKFMGKTPTIVTQQTSGDNEDANTSRNPLVGATEQTIQPILVV